MNDAPSTPTTEPQVPAQPVSAAARAFELGPHDWTERLIPIEAFDFYPKEKQ